VSDGTAYLHFWTPPAADGSVSGQLLRKIEVTDPDHLVFAVGATVGELNELEYVPDLLGGVVRTPLSIFLTLAPPHFCGG
jgi:hypothetical protein